MISSGEHTSTNHCGLCIDINSDPILKNINTYTIPFRKISEISLPYISSQKFKLLIK